MTDRLREPPARPAPVAPAPPAAWPPGRPRSCARCARRRSSTQRPWIPPECGVVESPFVHPRARHIAAHHDRHPARERQVQRRGRPEAWGLDDAALAPALEVGKDMPLSRTQTAVVLQAPDRAHGRLQAPAARVGRPPPLLTCRIARPQRVLLRPEQRGVFEGQHAPITEEGAIDGQHCDRLAVGPHHAVAWANGLDGALRSIGHQHARARGEAGAIAVAVGETISDRGRARRAGVVGRGGVVDAEVRGVPDIKIGPVVAAHQPRGLPALPAPVQVPRRTVGAQRVGAARGRRVARDVDAVGAAVVLHDGGGVDPAHDDVVVGSVECDDRAAACRVQAPGAGVVVEVSGVLARTYSAHLGFAAWVAREQVAVDRAAAGATHGGHRARVARDAARKRDRRGGHRRDLALGVGGQHRHGRGIARGAGVGVDVG